MPAEPPHELPVRSITPPREPDRFIKDRLTELTFHYSLDSYRAPSLNAPILARELLSLIRTVRKTGKGDGDLKHLLAELKYRISADQVAAEMIGLPATDILPESADNIDEMEARARIVRDKLQLQPYLDRTLEVLQHESGQHKPSRSKIDSLLSSAVTTLVNMGIANSYLHATAKQFFDAKSDMPINDKLSVLWGKILGARTEYDVLLVVEFSSAAVKSDHYDYFNIQFCDEVPADFSVDARPNKEVENLTVNAGQTVAIIKNIPAPDPHAAVSRAIENFRRLFDLAALFDHKSVIEVSKSARALSKADKKCVRVTAQRNSMTFIDEKQTARVLKSLNSLLNDVKIKNPEDFSKFVRAITLHGQALTSSDIESQFINLWTALEIMGRNFQRKTIVEDVITSILPVISLNYPSRIVDHWGKQAQAVAPDFVDFVKGACSDLDWREAFLTKRMDVKDHEHACGILTVRPALLFRSFNIGSKLSKPEKLLKDLERHEQVVRWQLRRIYRVRNIIAHSGVSPSYTASLLGNAHDYLDQVFSEVGARFCSPHPHEKISDIFMHCDLRLSHWKRNLGQTKVWGEDLKLLAPPGG